MGSKVSMTNCTEDVWLQWQWIEDGIAEIQANIYILVQDKKVFDKAEFLSKLDPLSPGEDDPK